ncbi:MAG: hypothetical protein ACK5YR_10475 [Pirellula sp.]
MSGRNLKAIRSFRRSLVDLAKTQSFKDATAAKQFDMLNKMAFTEIELDDPPEVQIAKEQFLLEFQWVCISQFGNELKLLKAIISRLDKIGYPCPTRWGVLRLDLADILDNRGRHDEAIKLRELVRGEYHTLGELVEGLVLVRLS